MSLVENSIFKNIFDENKPKNPLILILTHWSLFETPRTQFHKLMIDISCSSLNFELQEISTTD